MNKNWTKKINWMDRPGDYQNMTEEQLKQLEEEYTRENMKIWYQWKELENGRK